jgi:hypothetical protein
MCTSGYLALLCFATVAGAGEPDHASGHTFGTKVLAVEAIAAFLVASLDPATRGRLVGPASIAPDIVWHSIRTQGLQCVVDMHDHAVDAPADVCGGSSGVNDGAAETCGKPAPSGQSLGMA